MCAPLHPHIVKLPELARSFTRTLGGAYGPESHGRSGFAAMCAAHNRAHIVRSGARTLSEREKLALALAEKAIEQASISAKQKSERRADLTPGIAPFWAVFWEPNQTHSSKEKP